MSKLEDKQAKKLVRDTVKDINKVNKDNYSHVPETGQFITKEKLKSHLPKGTNTQVTDEILDLINNMGATTELPQELLEQDLMSYMHLIGKNQGTGIKDLINAVKYCNLKRNMSNNKAWEIVFPEKAKERKDKGLTIDNFTSMYNNSKLVTMIDKDMLIPTYIQYSAYKHKAMSIMANMMMGVSPTGDKVSPMVMHLSAKEILDRTDVPEMQEIEIKVGPTDEAKESQDRLFNQMNDLALQQQKLLAAGHDLSSVQKLNIKQKTEDDIMEVEYE